MARDMARLNVVERRGNFKFKQVYVAAQFIGYYGSGADAAEHYDKLGPRQTRALGLIAGVGMRPQHYSVFQIYHLCKYCRCTERLKTMLIRLYENQMNCIL